MQKQKRIVNQHLLAHVRSLPCQACGIFPTDDNPNHPHHVSARGMGDSKGDDIESNLMPLCPTHHIEWHKIGPQRMITKYHGVYKWLLNNERYDLLGD